MSMNNSESVTADLEESSHWDTLINHVKAYRERVGSPSFQSLADRVAAARVEAGMDAYAARVGKTTIYDCFKTGRARVNVPLVREVALVMGVTDEQFAAWVKECHRLDEVEEAPRALTRREWMTIAVMCVAISLVGRLCVVFLDLPLHLDMIGTAMAAFVLGPWSAVAVGVVTSGLGVGISGLSSAPFALVQVAGGLAWGYGIRRWRTGESVVNFAALTVAVAVVCSVVATPIIMLLTSWEPRESFARSNEAFAVFWGSEAASLFAGNVVTSVFDKLLSAFIALVFVAAMASHISARLPLAHRLSPRE